MVQDAGRSDLVAEGAAMDAIMNPAPCTPHPIPNTRHTTPHTTSPFTLHHAPDMHPTPIERGSFGRGIFAEGVDPICSTNLLQRPLCRLTPDLCVCVRERGRERQRGRGRGRGSAEEREREGERGSSTRNAKRETGPGAERGARVIRACRRTDNTRVYTNSLPTLTL